MANLVENLADYLAANLSGSLVVGTDIFIGSLPEETDNAILIDQTGGVEADRDIPVEKPTIQVLVRNTAYNTGLEQAKAIYDLIHQLRDNTVLKAGGVDMMYCFALQEPSHIGKDENNRQLFTTNYVFELRG